MHQPNPFLITLCKQLETRLGFKIMNISDAQKCTEKLGEEKLFISSHTIARLYGVVKPYRNPYKDTLNIIAKYLNYNDWESFCADQTNVPFDPNYFLTEASDGFSLAVLQMTLVNEDLIGLKTILAKAKEKVNKNEAILFTVAELIGTYVRKSKKQKELLELLADDINGHFFFFECFVDEDNENNYFSKALLDLYLPKVNNDYKRLFVYSFIISQTAHKKNILSNYSEAFLDLTTRLDKSKCHFHELSRWFECLIIIDGFNNKLHNTWKYHLYELLELSIDFKPNEKAWLFYRILKSLLLFGFKEVLFNCEEFNNVIDNMIKNKSKQFHNIALYLIQLYWIAKSMYFNNKTLYTPFRIHNILFQNESNEKIAIEFAVASLFATGENKIIIESNLKNYCKEKGVNWVLELIC